MNFGSLYARLRLTAAATQADIKSAYYRLSKIYHPDKTNNCPKASVQFRNITEAYETLSDPKAKAKYDAEHFPKQVIRGVSTRFRTSYHRGRFQDNPVNTKFDEFDLPIRERMKQYRKQTEKKQE